MKWLRWAVLMFVVCAARVACGQVVGGDTGGNPSADPVAELRRLTTERDALTDANVYSQYRQCVHTTWWSIVMLDRTMPFDPNRRAAAATLVRLTYAAPTGVWMPAHVSDSAALAVVRDKTASAERSIADGDAIMALTEIRRGFDAAAECRSWLGVETLVLHESGAFWMLYGYPGVVLP